MLTTLLGTRVYFKIPDVDNTAVYLELAPLISDSGPDWVQTFRPLSVIRTLEKHGIVVVNPEVNTPIDYDSLGSASKVFFLQMQLTVDGLAAENRLAKACFDNLYLQFGLPGVQVLYDSGHDLLNKVADLWMECHQSVGELAQKLNLK